VVFVTSYRKSPKTPAFRPGIQGLAASAAMGLHALLLEVAPDDLQGLPALAGCKVARRPEGVPPVALLQLRVPLFGEVAGNALQAVDQSGYRGFGRVLHQQVHVVVASFRRASPRNRGRPPRKPRAGSHRCSSSKTCRRYSGDEDQMDVHAENATPTGSEIACVCHRPSISLRYANTQGV